MEDDGADTRQLKPITECGWSTHYKTIYQLWWIEEKTFPEVQAILAREYHVSVTYKPFLTRIKRWKLEKNFKEAEVATIALEILHCQAFGLKLPTCFIRDKVVTPLRVREYARKKLMSVEQLAERAPSCPPSSVRFQNDRPQRAITDPAAYRQPEQVLRGIDVYFLGSLDSGRWLKWTNDQAPSFSFELCEMRLRLVNFSTGFQDAVVILGKGRNEVAFTKINSIMDEFLDLVVEEDPMFLKELLAGIATLIHHQFLDIASNMLKFASQAARTQRGQHHPLSHICSFLRDLEPSLFLPITYYAVEILRKNIKDRSVSLPFFKSSTFMNPSAVEPCKCSDAGELSNLECLRTLILLKLDSAQGYLLLPKEASEANRESHLFPGFKRARTKRYSPS